MCFKFPWKRLRLTEDCASRRPRATGKIHYAAAATMDAVIRVCGVPFAAHTVRCFG